METKRIGNLWGMCVFPGEGEDFEQDWGSYENEAQFFILKTEETGINEYPLPEGSEVVWFWADHFQYNGSEWESYCYDMSIEIPISSDGEGGEEEEEE